MKIKNLDINFTIVKTIADGSCLIHSILQSFSQEYKDLKTDREKSIMAREVRFHLANVLEVMVEKDKNIYQSLSRGELEELSKYIEETKLDYMKKYMNSNNFLTFNYIELLSEIFDINIIFLSEKEKDIYYSGDNDLLFKENRDSIFVNYIDQTHFESVKVGEKFLFNSKDTEIKKIKKLFK